MTYNLDTPSGQCSAYSTFEFAPGGDRPWVMRIVTPEGKPPQLLINREDYPDIKEDAFAKAVMDIVTRQFGDYFEKRRAMKDE